MTYLDQIDADKAAVEFLEALAVAAYQRTPHVQIEWKNHEQDGRTGLLWVHGELAAVTVVARNDFNRSVLVTHEVSAFAHLMANMLLDRITN